MTKMTPSVLIAKAIQQERKRAGISLSALAAQAGVAKSTLSQLEAGHGNPSLETLWTIANALDVPISYLFEPSLPESVVVRADSNDQMTTEASGLSTTMLARCPPGRRRDLFRVRLQQGIIRTSEPHPMGVIEHVIVCSGVVRLGPVDNLQELAVGDYFRFPADVQHSYESLSDTALLGMTMETLL